MRGSVTVRYCGLPEELRWWQDILFFRLMLQEFLKLKCIQKNPNKVGHQMHENSSFLLFIFHKMAKSVVIHQIENNCSVIPSVYVRDKVCKNNLYKVLSYNYIDYMLDFKKLSINIKDLDNFYQWCSILKKTKIMQNIYTCTSNIYCHLNDMILSQLPYKYSVWNN